MPPWQIACRHSRLYAFMADCMPPLLLACDGMPPLQNAQCVRVAEVLTSRQRRRATRLEQQMPLPPRARDPGESRHRIESAPGSASTPAPAVDQQRCRLFSSLDDVFRVLLHAMRGLKIRPSSDCGVGLKISCVRLVRPPRQTGQTVGSAVYRVAP